MYDVFMRQFASHIDWDLDFTHRYGIPGTLLLTCKVTPNRSYVRNIPGSFNSYSPVESHFAPGSRVRSDLVL